MKSAEWIEQLRLRGIVVEVALTALHVRPASQLVGEIGEMVVGLASALRRERHDAACLAPKAGKRQSGVETLGPLVDIG